MEYPELKRAVREQFEPFRPSVVLIEDKASGTQLIQELIVDGLYAAARPLGGIASSLDSRLGLRPPSVANRATSSHLD
jgi:hypothetical protein